MKEAQPERAIHQLDTRASPTGKSNLRARHRPKLPTESVPTSQIEVKYDEANSNPGANVLSHVPRLEFVNSHLNTVDVSDDMQF
jgi:hypothetical protein